MGVAMGIKKLLLLIVKIKVIKEKSRKTFYVICEENSTARNSVTLD